MDEKTLNELEVRLLSLKSELKNRLKENLSRVHMYESGDEGDYSNAIYIKDTLYDLIEKDRNTLIDIEESLYRIEKNTYGKCEMCGNDIEVGRMEAKPTAKYCMKCKSLVENRKRII